LKNDKSLLKYIEGLHSYIHHTILFFKPRYLDEVCIQVQYLEECGRLNREDYHSNSKPHENDKVTTSSTKEENKKKRGHCSYCDKDDHMKDGCWKLDPD